MRRISSKISSRPGGALPVASCLCARGQAADPSGASLSEHYWCDGAIRLTTYSKSRSKDVMHRGSVNGRLRRKSVIQHAWRILAPHPQAVKSGKTGPAPARGNRVATRPAVCRAIAEELQV